MVVEHLKQAEQTANRFIEYVNSVVSSDIEACFIDFNNPRKLKFYIIYATTRNEKNERFDQMVSYIKKYANADVNRELFNLIEMMKSHREQCKAHSEINLVTLRLANKELSKVN
jgi:hypothetical protein